MDENDITFDIKSGLKRLLYSNSTNVITLGEGILPSPSPTPTPTPTPTPPPNIAVCE